MTDPIQAGDAEMHGQLDKALDTIPVKFGSLLDAIARYV